jgi:hypothetical protein
LLVNDFKTLSLGYAYTLCGWHTISDILLTGLPTSVRDSETVDVHIQVGSGHSPIAKYADRVVFKHLAEYSLIGIQDVADFKVSNGQQIRIWPAAGADLKDIEIFLFGAVWGALCHQRGILPLHASAIVTQRGITAFAGHCGAGKSTTAALASELRYPLLTDDVLPVNFSQELVAGAWPFLRRLKLRNDSIIELKLQPTESVSALLDKEKYFVLPKHAAPDKWSRLERLYVLEIDSTISSISIDRITGAEAVGALVEQTYLSQFIRSTGKFRDHLAFCTQLASKIPIYRLRRSPSFGLDSGFGSIVRAHLEAPPT